MTQVATATINPATEIVSVQFTRETLERFIEVLNAGHVKQDGYTTTYSLRWWDETTASIYEALNSED